MGANNSHSESKNTSTTAKDKPINPTIDGAGEDDDEPDDW